MFLNIRNSHVTISKLTRLPIKEDKKPQENIKHKMHVNLEETLKFTKNFKHTHSFSLSLQSKCHNYFENHYLLLKNFQNILAISTCYMTA